MAVVAREAGEPDIFQAQGWNVIFVAHEVLDGQFLGDHLTAYL